MRGYVEALTDGVADAEQGRYFLETIARHTHRMERLVRDLLRLARLDAGQEMLERVTGLGLAVMKHLVELHGGKVSGSKRNADRGGAPRWAAATECQRTDVQLRKESTDA